MVQPGVETTGHKDSNSQIVIVESNVIRYFPTTGNMSFFNENSQIAIPKSKKKYGI